MKTRTALRSAALVAIAATAAQSTPLAPTGSHYAGRSTDTGFASVSNLGGYSTSIALDLPAARGGMTVPISIDYGGRRRVGTAGMGWDMPLSFVRIDSSISHRRPAFKAGLPPEGREQVTVSIAGTSTLLASGGTDANGQPMWIGRDDAVALQLTKEPNIGPTTPGGWRLRDGNGQEFVFSKSIDSTTADLWLLESIVTPTNRMKLEYSPTTPRVFPYDQGDGCARGNLECATGAGADLELKRVVYNNHPTSANCWKNEITFDYNPDQNEPLALWLLGPKPIVRSHTLRAVNVRASESCGPSQQIRKYEFEYDSDPDTSNPRLRSVWLRGKDGTARLPFGAYEYGQIKNGVGEIRFKPMSPSISLPTEAIVSPGPTPIASTEFDASNDGTSARNLIDFTGDGRPDLVFRRNNQLWLARNVPQGSGTRFAAPVQLSNAVFTARPLAYESGYNVNLDPYNVQHRNDEWRRVMDINGDGRMDIIDAREQANTWTVYLNTPGAPVTWIKQAVSVADVRARLAERGHVIQGSFVPLSRKSTGRDTSIFECWEWTSAQTWRLETLIARCSGYPNPHVQSIESGEKTITEWDVRDINGDGYPDILFTDGAASHPYKPDPLLPGTLPVLVGANPRDQLV